MCKYLVENYYFKYQNSNVIALNGIDMTVNEAETILLIGENGCGKTTLFRGLSAIIPNLITGTYNGSILFDGESIEDTSVLSLAGKVGILLQDPDSQICNMNIDEEICFGMRNLCQDKNEILTTLQQVKTELGLDYLGNTPTYKLSGGEKQRLAIASLLAMKPSVIILDEPISSLDPLGVYQVISLLQSLLDKKITVIICTHIIEPFLDIANRVVLLSNGKIVDDFTIEKLIDKIDLLKRSNVDIPPPCLVKCKAKELGISVDGKYTSDNFIAELYQLTTDFEGNSPRIILEDTSRKFAIQCTDVCFRYKKGRIILDNINIQIGKSEKIVIWGKNGSGKTTLVKLLSGIYKPSKGKVRRRFKNPYFCFQNSFANFSSSTVKGELERVRKSNVENIDKVIQDFGISDLYEKSPFELSGGEKKRVSLALAFLRKSDFLILDEPTAELDKKYVDIAISYINAYNGCLILVSHDIRLLALPQYRFLIIENCRIESDKFCSEITFKEMKSVGFEDAYMSYGALSNNFPNGKIYSTLVSTMEAAL